MARTVLGISPNPVRNTIGGPSLADELGVSVEDLALQKPPQRATVAEVREAFLDYLALKPAGHQASKAYDLVRFMARADKHISEEENLILDELAMVEAQHSHVVATGESE